MTTDLQAAWEPGIPLARRGAFNCGPMFVLKDDDIDLNQGWRHRPGEPGSVRYCQGCRREHGCPCCPGYGTCIQLD